MNVAICVPSRGVPEETFINNHINNLPFNITVIYGGEMPYKSKGIKEIRLLRLWFKIIEFIRRGNEIKEKPFKDFELKRILQRKKIDVVLAEYLLVAGFVTEICKKANTPLVATALGYDISNNQVIENNLKRYQSLFSYCSFIVIVSNHMRKRLHELGCAKDKIIYSPAGPDKSFFKLLPTFKKKQIFALGRFVDKKAPYLTILAFSKIIKIVPDARLIFGGDGPLLEVCEDLINGLGINNSVKIIGIISQEKQRKLLKDSLMFVQHSKVAISGNEEGTPVAILEACAAGLPIVSTIHAGIPEVVENGKTGFLVKEKDVDGMAEKMLTLLCDIELAKQMGAAGKKYVAKHFTLNHHINKISELIEKSKNLGGLLKK